MAAYRGISDPRTSLRWRSAPSLTAAPPREQWATLAGRRHRMDLGDHEHSVPEVESRRMRSRENATD
jgi:hypothetical protein